MDLQCYSLPITYSIRTFYWDSIQACRFQSEQTFSSSPMNQEYYQALFDYRLTIRKVGILADKKILYLYGVATLMIMIYSTRFLLVDFILNFYTRYRVFKTDSIYQTLSFSRPTFFSLSRCFFLFCDNLLRLTGYNFIHIRWY